MEILPNNSPMNTGLLKIANGTETLPEPLIKTKKKDSAKISANKTEIECWQKQDNNTFAQITLNMEDGAMADVMEMTSAHKAWTKVIEHWEGKGMQSLSYCYQQLMSAKINKEEDISTWFNNVQSIASKMKTLGEPVTNIMLTQVLMNALPPSYAIVSMVIQTSNQTVLITLEMVTQAALAEEEQWKKGSGLTAMFAPHSQKPPT